MTAFPGQFSADGNARLHVGNHYQYSTSYYNNPGRSSLGYCARKRRNKHLIKAAKEGMTQRLKAQLNAGADIDFRDADGWTALHHAVENGYKDCVRALIDAGSDVNARAPERDRIMGDETFPLLMTTTLDESHDSMLSILIQAPGIAVNQVEPRTGYTALHYTAFHMVGDGEQNRILMEAGADINIRDKVGNTPIQHAVQYGSARTLNILLSKSYLPKLDLPNEQGWTPLHYAIDRCNLEKTKALLIKLASHKVKVGAGYTPLELAAQRGWYEGFVAIVELRRVTEFEELVPKIISWADRDRNRNYVPDRPQYEEILDYIFATPNSRWVSVRPWT